MARPFYLGLNMPGTVSAGAYTAGVIDFLIEAMDAWYAERGRQTQQFGSDYDKWTIPAHELELSVMAGASGGGITAALTAAALNGEFGHVRKQKASENSSTNSLFQSWVLNIDLGKLLGHADLDASGSKVSSLLDSTPIRDIAAKAFTVQSPLASKRPWVKDGLRVILTLTNLRGVPYALEPQTDSDSARVLYHADRQDFIVPWSGSTIAPNTLLPNGGGAWPQLAQAAMATSAFPVVLAPQKLSRSAAEYDTRTWSIVQADPKCAGDGTCICETNEPMPPTWDEASNAQFETLNVDGGATNNSPLDCARMALASLDPPVANGHNPREPKSADRAVINIAPLAAEIPAKLPAPIDDSLLSLPGAVINALLAQSRIQGENLKLSSDPKVASRWVISPTTEVQGAEPLAGALMSGFGAFVSEIFREHDYQLGRRNCQRFLTAYFGVPWNNVVLQQQPVSKASQDRVDTMYGFSSEADPQLRLCPLIPVMPALRPEIAVARAALHRDQLSPLADLAM
ncbi:MAG: patatin-like phospholipase family protein, partial [Acidobacteriaceae bacterium]|nr:patatin-like phospholipase family protein [Acidobacteriaceae bacterium]